MNFGFRISDFGLQNRHGSAVNGWVTSQSAIRNPQSVIAFTLVELMVSVAITALLILAINQVFSSVSKAVRIGIGASEVLQNSRILGDQLERDFKTQRKPTEGGFMVIVNNDISANVLPEDAETSTPKRMVRSDQIAFIRARNSDEQPIAPGADDRYDAAPTAATDIRVFYGHGMRTDPNGTGPSTSGLGTADGPNEFASQWILCRQALFLDLTINTRSITGFPSPWYSNGATQSSNLANVSTPLSAPELNSGLCDVANRALTGDSDSNGVVSLNNRPGSGAGSDILWADESPSEYYLRAKKYMFVNERIRVNPLPDTTSYEAWRVGQMHSYLAGHVVDFVVEFAGDYDGSPGIDTNSSTHEIIWYSMKNPPPTTANGFVDSTNSTLPDSTNGQPIQANTSLPAAADYIFTFRHGSGSTNWPYLIRIRYRLVDSKGQIAGADGEPGRWFEQIMKVKQ